MSDFVPGKALNYAIVPLRVETELEDAAGLCSAVLGYGEVYILLKYLHIHHKICICKQVPYFVI